MTSDAEFTYSYDSLGRAISRQNKPLGSSSTAIINESYSYLKGANNSATSLIERIGTTGIKKEDEAGNLVNTDLSYKYDYDANGNITKIYQTVSGEDILRQSYEYDAQNQLTRENNAVLNKTVVYKYTSGGNILAKIEYPYTTASEITTEPTNTISYAYGDSNWKDKLTAYDGQSITYDEIGNPLTYGDLSFTWEKGRRLSQITDGENTYSYTYNADGIRTSKTVNGVRIDYVLEGDRIVYQKYSTGEEIWYNYDAAGKLLGFHRRTAEGLTGNYYYIRNGQGDILGFHNQSGRVVVRYTYDAWGKVISITGSMAGTLGKMNPFRYRGYYYDEETELYYLNSRYYNPDWGRFLNADNLFDKEAGMLASNIYTYCGNNPVNYIDPTGQWIIKDAIKWFTKNVCEPIVNTVKKTFAQTNKVVMYSENVDGAAVAKAGFSRSIAIDTKGNIALLCTANVGGGTPDAGISVSKTVMYAPSYKDVLNEGIQAGGSASIFGISAGADYVCAFDLKNSQQYHGYSTSMGVGLAPIEAHGTLTYTTEIFSINIWEPLDSLYESIDRW